jgi:hypothetical protein
MVARLHPAGKIEEWLSRSGVIPFCRFALKLHKGGAKLPFPRTWAGAGQGETMFTPQSLGIALLMMITSAICWGSWANTFKGVKNYRFELFYWDYAVGIFVVSLILAFTMGSSGHNSASFLNNVHAADGSRH